MGDAEDNVGHDGELESVLESVPGQLRDMEAVFSAKDNAQREAERDRDLLATQTADPRQRLQSAEDKLETLEAAHQDALIAQEDMAWITEADRKVLQHTIKSLQDKETLQDARQQRLEAECVQLLRGKTVERTFRKKVERELDAEMKEKRKAMTELHDTHAERRQAQEQLNAYVLSSATAVEHNVSNVQRHPNGLHILDRENESCQRLLFKVRLTFYFLTEHSSDRSSMGDQKTPYSEQLKLLNQRMPRSKTRPIPLGICSTLVTDKSQHSNQH